VYHADPDVPDDLDLETAAEPRWSNRGASAPAGARIGGRRRHHRRGPWAAVTSEPGRGRQVGSRVGGQVGSRAGGQK
jgi:hypothetical protein